MSSTSAKFKLAQYFALVLILTVFLSAGMYQWNLAAIEGLKKEYSTKSMVLAADKQFSTDIQQDTVRVIWLMMNPHLYGSRYFPGIPDGCGKEIVDESVDTFVQRLITVEDAYWHGRYYELYPGPYLDYARAYNANVVRHLHDSGDPCIRKRLGEEYPEMLGRIVMN